MTTLYQQMKNTHTKNLEKLKGVDHQLNQKRSRSPTKSKRRSPTKSKRSKSPIKKSKRTKSPIKKSKRSKTKRILTPDQIEKKNLYKMKRREKVKIHREREREKDIKEKRYNQLSKKDKLLEDIKNLEEQIEDERLAPNIRSFDEYEHASNIKKFQEKIKEKIKELEKL